VARQGRAARQDRAGRRAQAEWPEPQRWPAQEAPQARPERPAQPEKPERPARPEKPERPARPEKPERPARPETPGRPAKAGWLARGGRVQRASAGGPGVGGGGGGGGGGAGGWGGGGPCAGVVYPEAPAGAATTQRVSWSCGDDATGDGSAEQPFKSVTASLNVAAEGTTILVEAGTYPETVAIKKNGIQLLGGPPGGSPTDAAIIFQSSATYPLYVSGASQVLVRGVKIEGATGAAVGVTAGEATLEGCAIVGTKMDQGQFGQGLVASEGSQVTLRNSLVSAGEAQGIIFQNSAGLIEKSEIAGNADAGIWLVEAGETTIQSNDIHDNGGAGVLSMGSRAIIFQNQIHKTQKAAWGGGDGVLATSVMGANNAVVESDVDVKENVLIADNARTGILLDGSAHGIIFQNSSVNQNGRAGIWAQNSGGSMGPMLSIEGNGLSKNKQSGLVLLGMIQATVGTNVVSQTTLATTVVPGGSTEMVGDGVSLFDGAVGALMANTIAMNGRIGILADDAGAGTSMIGNGVNGNTHGIIFQNNASGLGATPGANTVDGDDIQSSASVLFGVTKEPLAGTGP
jgi:parallel beta-helix repeat protein